MNRGEIAGLTRRLIARPANGIKHLIMRSLPPRIRQNIYDWKDVWIWTKKGRREPPPPLVKRKVVRHYGRKFGLRTMVETGTFKGDMVSFNRKSFERLFTIELDPKLHDEASARFVSDPKVVPLRGDSSSVLPNLLEHIDERCLFWLDAHYSGGITARGMLETPIRIELDRILQHRKDHVILIDDARLFTGEGGYPTLEEIEVLAHESAPEAQLSIEHDIIRIHPRIQR